MAVHLVYEMVITPVFRTDEESDARRRGRGNETGRGSAPPALSGPSYSKVPPPPERHIPRDGGPPGRDTQLCPRPRRRSTPGRPPARGSVDARPQVCGP